MHKYLILSITPVVNQVWHLRGNRILNSDRDASHSRCTWNGLDEITSVLGTTTLVLYYRRKRRANSDQYIGKLSAHLYFLQWRFCDSIHTVLLTTTFVEFAPHPSSPFFLFFPIFPLFFCFLLFDFVMAALLTPFCFATTWIKVECRMWYLLWSHTQRNWHVSRQLKPMTGLMKRLGSISQLRNIISLKLKHAKLRSYHPIDPLKRMTSGRNKVLALRLSSPTFVGSIDQLGLITDYSLGIGTSCRL